MRTMFIIIVDDPSIPAGKMKKLADALQLAAGKPTFVECGRTRYDFFPAQALLVALYR